MLSLTQGVKDSPRSASNTREAMRRGMLRLGWPAWVLVVSSLSFFPPTSAHAGVRTLRGVGGVATTRAITGLREMGREMPGAQTVTPFQPVSNALPVPAHTPALASDPPPAPAPSADAPTLASSFAAMDDDNTKIPPDTNGTVGPDHLMVTLNSAVRIQDRSGAVLSTVGLGSFWSTTGTTSVFDPKVVYDPFGARFIFTAMSDSKSGSSSVLLGVTATSDPTGTWYLYRFDADAANLVWADYPSIGFNKNWIVVQVNMYDIAAPGAFNRSHVYAFSKSDAYAHGAGTYTKFSDSSIGATQSPAITMDATTSTEYMLEDWNGSAGTLRMFTITGAVGSETFTIGSFVTVAETWSEAPSGDFAPQSGTSEKIQNNDARMHNVVYRDGSLWAAHTVFLPAGGSPTRSAIQWWQISTTGTVEQRARIDDASGAFYAFPSIAVNAYHDVAIGYSRYAATQFASANYSFRYGADALNTLQADTVLRAGDAKYVKKFSGTRNRWGDYSATSVDPANDLDLWTIQEYAASPSGGADRWATWWGKIVPGGAPVVSLSPASVGFGSVLVGRTSPSTTVTVTNAGTAPLAIGTLTKGGINTSDFAMSADLCSGHSVFAGSSCTVNVTFAPSATGARAASLSIPSNAAGSPHVVPLSGTGTVDATPPVSAFTTAANSVIVRGLGTVAGTVTDDAAGVSSLTLTFTPLLGSASTMSPTPACNVPKTSCTWTSSVPLLPGVYTVNARATDASANAEAPGATRTFVII